MATNQFNNQLGYYQGTLSAPFTATNPGAGVWKFIEWVIVDMPQEMYNTSSYRDSPEIGVTGWWKIEYAFTVNSGTNNDFVFRVDDAPYIKWNARGGNNWALNYSIIKYYEIGDRPSAYIKNLSGGTNSATFMNATLNLIKIY